MSTATLLVGRLGHGHLADQDAAGRAAANLQHPLAFEDADRLAREIMMGALDGRRVLVTGGSRGIGRAIVERLARDGADVAFSYATNRAAADEVLSATAELGGSVHAAQADLASVADARGLFATAEERLGGLDILVNNAGVGVMTTFADATEADYDPRHGRERQGHVLPAAGGGTQAGRRRSHRNVSTINTVLHAPGLALYAASKGAIEQFTEVAAKELGARGITVNTVSPGFTDTDLLRGATPAEAMPQLAGMSPRGHGVVPTGRRGGATADLAHRGLRGVYARHRADRAARRGVQGALARDASLGLARVPRQRRRPALDQRGRTAALFEI